MESLTKIQRICLMLHALVMITKNYLILNLETSTSFYNKQEVGYNIIDLDATLSSLSIGECLGR